MSAKHFVYDDRGQPKKIDGWFSWRHKTRDAHDQARAQYLSEHGRAARRRKAAERTLTPEERVLIRIFGKEVTDA